MRRAGLVLALGLAVSAAAWSQSGVSSEEGRPTRHGGHPAPAHKPHPAGKHAGNISARPRSAREKQLLAMQKRDEKRQKRLAKQQAKDARRNTQRAINNH
jgi:hypothetical protein